jgi:hypothetical protein
VRRRASCQARICGWQFLEKLALVIPRPRINLLLYHGAFAPRGRCHSGPVVVEHAPHRVAPPASASPSPAPAADAPPAAYARPRYFAWADLLRRVFAFDVLACWRAPTAAGG